MLSLPIAFTVPLGYLHRFFAPRVAACASPHGWRCPGAGEANADGASPDYGTQCRV
jgi:hypothetical protein